MSNIEEEREEEISPKKNSRIRKNSLAQNGELLEASTRRLMRVLVILMFVLCGPLIIIFVSSYWIDTSLTGAMLDIFKIWLGSIIGISTNVIQKE